MTSTEDKIVQQLTEARAMELALVRTLQAHIAMTPGGRYRGELERHLRETRDHADRISRRLADLGSAPSTVQSIYGVGQQVIGQLLALGKAPLDMVRGASAEEKLLKNAKDECATEQLEIATYDALEALARIAGDEATARLARDHRADEERMLATLRELLPGLTAGVVSAEVDGRPRYDVTGTGAARTVTDVAERAAEAAERQEPFRGYDELNADTVVRRLNDLSPARLRRIEAYERAHKRRRTVIEASERCRAAKERQRSEVSG